MSLPQNVMPSFTPDSELDLLFSPTLIPANVKAQLGSDLHMRPLAKTDITRSHLSVLSVLTSTSTLSESQYFQAFESLRACPNTYFTLVIVSRETDQIVGVGSVFLEQKFTRNLGKVGHIEDIAVDKSTQGRKLGLRIIQALSGISENAGCYKTILNCSDANIRMCYLTVLWQCTDGWFLFAAFYQKCGFEKKENEMARYHNIADRPLHTPRL
ncbi:hypothetical protein CVT25_007526 [Psilocybe cyanescens]|uniref:Glucosamine 6-phosphate N-acetyltransferase n=1 Tax=Psilocybe cyanescens TaxID=93625 RepID=A0A409XGD4_PSICY|nr:hypothetical protein CVT25_007526 [Psilocybe cyanescens]